MITQELHNNRRPTAARHSPWVQFRENMLTARETRRKATIDAVRRFVVSILWSAHSLVKAVIDARLSCVRTWFPPDFSSVARSCAAWANWFPAHGLAASLIARSSGTSAQKIRNEEHVSNQTKCVILKTLFRNHRGGRRPSWKCPTAYP